ncbi:MAG: disulfide bond formation protein B [Rhodobacteraceae bacterium]|nr:disulfide bond formation protein B [Paracoccaceae bacterium]
MATGANAYGEESPLGGLSANVIALIAMVIAAAALSAALISQYFFGLKPCPMCIWQRYPYAVGLVVAMIGLSVGRGPSRLMFALASLTFFAGAGLGLFHSGVELGWWAGLETCSAPSTEGKSASALLDSLMTQTELTRCDERQPFFLWLSMANWNTVISADVAFGFALAAARR